MTCTCPYNRMLKQKTYSLYCEDEDHRKRASQRGKVDAFSSQRKPDDQSH